MTTRVAVAAGLAAVYALFGVIGSVVQTAVGFPGVAGVVMLFVAPIVVVFSLRIFPRFGGTILMTLFYSILVLPFNVVGTPGFFYKIPIAVFAGLVAEILYLLPMRKSRLWVAAIAGIFEVAIGGLAVAVAAWLKVPGAAEVSAMWSKWWAIAAAFFIAALIGLLGARIYCRVEKRAIIKRVRKGMGATE